MFMKIAILGGSFDPPHFGHMLIAKQVKEYLDMDQIWLMPLFQSHQQPFDKILSNITHRFAMVKCLENDFVKISDFEINHNPRSYTIDTLDGLKKIYPQDEFYWITGSDQLDTFQQYRNWQKIISEHNLIVFPRETIVSHLTEKVKQKLQLQEIPKNVILMQDPDLILTNVSSTIIRDRIRRKLSLHSLVSEGV